MKTAFISTLGCAVLHKEGQLLKDYFRKNKYKIIDNPKKAANWHKQPITYAYVKKDSDNSILEELRDLRMVRGA